MKFYVYENLPPELAYRAARVHEGIPLAWDPLKIVSEQKVYLTAQKMMSNPNQIFIVVEDELKKIIGFHWINGEQSEARVMSTWVELSYRGNGLASKLKNAGEELMRRKFTLVSSKVHKKNEQMIRLNLKFGYLPVEEKTEFILFKKAF